MLVRCGRRGVRKQQQLVLVLDGRSRTRAPASTSTSGGAAGADASVVALVPAAVKSKGTLTVASDASYAPDEFVASDGHTVVGMDADLMKALGGGHGAEGRRS